MIDCPRISRHSQRRAAANEVESLVVPPAIQLFETRSGRPLGPKVQLAWAWLNNRAGGRLPAQFSFRLIDLALALQGSASSAGHRLLARLADEGLVIVLSRQRGRGGSITIRLNDPDTVTALRCEHGEPQRELFEDHSDTLSMVNIAHQGSLSPAPAQREVPTPPVDLESSTFGESPSKGPEKSSQSGASPQEVFANLPETVRRALANHLTPKEFTVLPGIAYLTCTEEGALKCLVEHEQELPSIKKNYGKQLRGAAQEAGLSGPEFGVDASVRNLLTVNDKLEDSRAPLHTVCVKAQSMGFYTPTNKQINLRTGQAKLSADGERVLHRAQELCDRVNNPTCYPKFFFFAAILEHFGELSKDRIEEFIAHPDQYFNSLVNAHLKKCRISPKKMDQWLNSLGIERKNWWDRSAHASRPRKP